MKKKHYMRDYSRQRRNERKIWALNHFGNKCGKCSSPKNLEFDHIDRTKKTINISSIFMYSWKVFLEELEKCQLLCRKCHDEKCHLDGSYRVRGATIHGTGTAYVHHRCRCPLCRKWKSKYYKQHKV